MILNTIIAIIALILSGVKFDWKDKSIAVDNIELSMLFLGVIYFIKHF